jgi:Sugar (and other) transporter
MGTSLAASATPWYRTLNREQWRVLGAANVAWLFDGFEIYALFLTVGFALHQLLAAGEYAALPRYAGYVLAATVFGWATGGVIGGIIADYLGRRRTMILTILAYSLTTGLSAFAWNWQSFAALRFIVGVGIGDRRGDRLGVVARSCTRQGRGDVAVWRGDWRSGCLGGLAGDRRAGAERVALYVPGGCAAGTDNSMDLAEHSRITSVAVGARASPRGARTAAERGRTYRRTRRADPFHGG